jgi:hypothetical protein
MQMLALTPLFIAFMAIAVIRTRQKDSIDCSQDTSRLFVLLI